jgi:kynurenine formamidase
VIACSYSTLTGCGNKEVVMPNMDWHFYRNDNDKLINFNLTKPPAVTKLNWVHAVVQPEETTVLEKQYKGAIAVTLDTCSLEFENSTKAVVATRLLFEKGYEQIQ